MKTKHTPGPWYASDNERCIYAKLQTVDGTYVEPLIAQCTKLSTSANANAALIAASPEMFSMLEQALRLIAVAENNNAYKDCALPLIGQRTIEQIESILKKARGE